MVTGGNKWYILHPDPKHNKRQQIQLAWQMHHFSQASETTRLWMYRLQEKQGEILRPYAPEVHFMSIFSIAYFQVQE